MNTARMLEALVLYGVLPLWLLAGAADWLCHRASDIEDTAGSRESRLHLLLFAEIALPVAAIAFLHVTAPVILFLAVGVLAHFVTSWVDTSYAQPRRYISPLEQQVHSFLEMLPLFGLVLICVLRPGEFVAPDWRVVPRSPLPAATWLVVGALALGAGFIIEEWWRCARQPSIAREAPSPPPGDA